jgi:hypothetical protein
MALNSESIELPIPHKRNPTDSAGRQNRTVFVCDPRYIDSHKKKRFHDFLQNFIFRRETAFLRFNKTESDDKVQKITFGSDTKLKKKKIIYIQIQMFHKIALVSPHDAKMMSIWFLGRFLSKKTPFNGLEHPFRPKFDKN